MGLVVSSEVDVATLFTTGNYDSNGGHILSEGGTALAGRTVYYDRLDVWIADWEEGTGGGTIIRFDPLLTQNTGIFDDVASPAGTARERFAVGEWDRGANTQHLYSVKAGGSPNEGFNRIEVLALNQNTVVDAFPTLGQTNHRGALLSTDAGYYDAASTSSWHFFETWGFAFNPWVRLRHTDLVQYAGVPVLVNLTTGAATLVEGLMTSYGSQTHKFSEPTLFDQIIDFTGAQFVPDDISTPTQPRGLMVLTSICTNNPANSLQTRGWVKIVDWNPFNVAGTPSRTHLRQRLLSAADFLKSSGGTFGGIFEGGATVGRRMGYHPRTNRLMFITSDVAGAQLDPGEMKILFLSPTPATSIVTEPSPLEQVVTGKTVAFFSEAIGTLAEKIAGATIAFQLRRVSSVDEVLTIVPATPGQTVVVANAPMSPTDPNVSPVIVKKNGVPLTLTTHYTVNRSTGEITFVGPEPVDGNVYTATYRHFATPASPPHGTLLNATGVTDISGAAVARIRYQEEASVPDRWDRLDAT